MGCAIGLGVSAPVLAATPQSGGILKFVVAGEAPSKDGHAETTYAVIHPYAPFYSLLIRVNPEDPQSTDFVCDLCEGGVPEPTENSTKYTFKIRTGVKFHDGTPLTAHDVVATYHKLIFPPDKIRSVRKAFFKMVESVTAPDDFTVVFKLKFPLGRVCPGAGHTLQLGLQQERPRHPWLQVASKECQRYGAIQICRAQTRGIR